MRSHALKNPRPQGAARRLLSRLSSRFSPLLAPLFPLLMSACGGGGGGNDPTVPAASCSVADQKAWLSSYMDDWYFWYRISPRPAAAAYASVDGYFSALLYTGSSADFPADRWSRSESTESYNRFFGDGATLGYGVSVAGVEVAGDASKPLYVRYVEPLSPAALQGVQRGDEILSLNGRSAASVVGANDFSALTAGQAGDTLTLELRRAGTLRTVVLRATVFKLSPVQGAAVITSPGGRRVGVLLVKDMISQALAPADAAFAQFRAAGVQDLVLDLRYNGGGLVSTGATLASYISGSRALGLSYAVLLYNDKRAAANNQAFAFSNPAAALALPRVYVLTGPRTCSASEQVINGLRGAGLAVTTIGDTTCGKPVGFLPASSCGLTYSVVNFESVNQRNEGRYFTGFPASCRVAEDFTAAQNGPSDPLRAAALRLADGSACAAMADDGRAGPLSLRRPGQRVLEPGERQDMVPR